MVTFGWAAPHGRDGLLVAEADDRVLLRRIGGGDDPEHEPDRHRHTERQNH